jgi:hypothetical protein
MHESISSFLLSEIKQSNPPITPTVIRAASVETMLLEPGSEEEQ